jgi:hypothetical protein
LGTRGEYAHREVVTVTTQTDEIEAAASELAHAMSRLVRAIDAVGDDGEAAGHISESMPEALQELASRLTSAQAFGS